MIKQELSKTKLLANIPELVPNIGTLICPTIKQLQDDEKMFNYIVLSKVTTCNLDELKSFFLKMGFDEIEGLEYPEDFKKFDFLTMTSLSIRAIFLSALSLVYKEQLIFSDTKKTIMVYQNDEKEEILVGSLDRDNYEDVEVLLRQLLYISDFENKTNQKKQTLSPQAQSVANMFEEMESKIKVADVYDSDYELDNIISKMCVAGIGYTLFNIYDLTVYQLYDQFMSYTQKKVWEIEKSVFSFNGGDSFNVVGWLKNNNKR